MDITKTFQSLGGKSDINIVIKFLWMHGCTLMDTKHLEILIYLTSLQVIARIQSLA